MANKEIYVLSVVDDAVIALDKKSKKAVTLGFDQLASYKQMRGHGRLEDISCFTCDLSTDKLNVQMCLASEFDPYYMKDIPATEQVPAKQVKTFITDELPELYLVCPMTVTTACALDNIKGKPPKSGALAMVILKVSRKDGESMQYTNHATVISYMSKALRRHLTEKFPGTVTFTLDCNVVTKFAALASRLQTLAIYCDDSYYLVDNRLVESIF